MNIMNEKPRGGICNEMNCKFENKRGALSNYTNFQGRLG